MTIPFSLTLQKIPQSLIDLLVNISLVEQRVNESERKLRGSKIKFNTVPDSLHVPGSAPD